MKTLLIRDIINQLNIPPPPSVPDHSILSGTFITSYYNLRHKENNYIKPFNANSSKSKRRARKNLKKVNDTFLMGPEVTQLVKHTIRKIENGVNTQAEVDEQWK